MPAEVIRLKRRTGYPPEAMVRLPNDERELISTAKELIETCRADVTQRLEYYRFLNLLTESGRKDGTKSLLNLIYTFLDRLSSHLFSPTDIRFGIDFENSWDDVTLKRAARVSRLLAHSWEKTSTDLLFAQGVFESLKYGLNILKQTVTMPGESKIPAFRSTLLKPWQFGVYRPDIADLDEQPAMVETIPMTLPEVWRRIRGLPDAVRLFDQIKASASQGGGGEVANNFNHPVLLSNQIQFSQPLRPTMGGVIGIGSPTQFSGLRADISAPTVLFHELWVWDEEDYTTIQLIEAPAGGGADILVAPRMKKANLLISGGHNTGIHPYTIIQPNTVASNIWGRSELHDLYELQDWASVTADDIKELLGLQIDKILAIKGDGLTDETYGQMRRAGYINVGMAGGVEDLTPKFPQEALQVLDKIIAFMEMISGFDNLLSGRGEPGVRSGVQANPLMKTAGARLKDRSLTVERQCAEAADKRLAIMEYKDGRQYWTDPKDIAGTGFLLSDLPEDRRVVVDGHTTSPVFADEHQSLIFMGARLGWVDAETGIEELPFQHKDQILSRLRAREEKQQQLMERLEKLDPEGFAKAVEKGLSGKKR